MRIINIFVMFLSVLLMGEVAIAEEKKEEFQPVKTGEIVRFDGYLFSPEAIVKVIAKSDKQLREAKLDCEHKLEVAGIDMQRVNDLAVMESRMQSKLLQDTILAKDQIIEEKLKTIDSLETRVNFNGYLLAGSFLAGSLATFAIIYYTVGIVK